MKNKVSIQRCSANDDLQSVDRALKKSLGLIGALDNSLYSGKKILIKPNILKGASYKSGATTNPFMIESLIRFLKSFDCTITIAEGAVVGYDTMEALTACGIDKISNRYGTGLVDLKKDRFIEKEVPGGKELESLKIPVTVLDSDFLINMSVLKTHDSFPATLGLKNIKGVISEHDKKRFHNSELAQCIVDLNKVVRTDLSIIDGTVGMEGIGPLYGEPVDLKTIFCSFDLIAADLIASRVMGLDPYSIKYIKLAIEQGISSIKEEDIDVVGYTVDEVKRDFKVIDLKSSACSQYLIDIMGEGACSGCLHTLESFLYKTGRNKDLDRLKGSTFILGKRNFSKDISGNKIIKFGKCAKDFYPEKGCYIKGCPPHMDTIREVLGIKK